MDVFNKLIFGDLLSEFELGMLGNLGDIGNITIHSLTYL
jgi:hypothetical protein